MELCERINVFRQTFDTNYNLDPDISIIDPDTGFQTRLVNLILSKVAKTQVSEKSFRAVISGELDNLQSSYLFEALKRKIEKIQYFNIDEDADIVFYDPDTQYSSGFDSNYANYIKLLVPEKIKRPTIETSYENKEDLLYDIYKANKIAEFFCSYDLSVDSSKFGDSYILNILYPFLYDKKLPGYKQFLSKCMTKDEFIKQYDRDPKLFPEVGLELNNPGHILKRSANKFSKAHNSNVRDLMKIAVFDSHIKNVVIPDMLKNIENNSDLFIEKFGDILTAKAKMLNQILSYSNSFLNPFDRNSVVFNQVDEIFMLYNLDFCDMRVYNDQSLKEKLDLLRKSLWSEDLIPLKVLRPPIDLSKVSKKGLRIKIFPNRAEPEQYKFLCPLSEDTIFSDGNRNFKSIDEYVNFKLYKNYMKYPDDKIEKLLPFGVNRLVEELNLSTKNKICQAMLEYMNIWFEKPKNKELILNETVGKNIIFPVEGVLGKILGNYLMILREDYAATIRNPIISNWTMEKIKEITNMIKLAREKLNAKIDTNAHILNFLNIVYRFKNINSDLKVAVNQEYTSSPILTYLNKFIAYTLLQVKEEKFQESIDEGKTLLQNLKDNISEKAAIKFVYDFAIRIRKTILKKRGDKNPSVEELSFVLSLINNRDVNINDESEIGNYINNKRIAFFMDTYKVEDNIVKDILADVDEEVLTSDEEKEKDEEEEDEEMSVDELFSGEDEASEGESD